MFDILKTFAERVSHLGRRLFEFFQRRNIFQFVRQVDMPEHRGAQL